MRAARDLYMIKNVYYLRHSITHERCFRYYETLVGARIAQRMRNGRLGYKTRVQRIHDTDLEFEQCVNSQGDLVLATWAIEEDHIDCVELINY